MAIAKSSPKKPSPQKASIKVEEEPAKKDDDQVQLESEDNYDDDEQE